MVLRKIRVFIVSIIVLLFLYFLARFLFVNTLNARLSYLLSDWGSITVEAKDPISELQLSYKSEELNLTSHFCDSLVIAWKIEANSVQLVQSNKQDTSELMRLYEGPDRTEYRVIQLLAKVNPKQYLSIRSGLRPVEATVGLKTDKKLDIIHSTILKISGLLIYNPDTSYSKNLSLTIYQSDLFDLTPYPLEMSFASGAEIVLRGVSDSVITHKDANMFSLIIDNFTLNNRLELKPIIIRDRGGDTVPVINLHARGSNAPAMDFYCRTQSITLESPRGTLKAGIEKFETDEQDQVFIKGDTIYIHTDNSKSVTELNGNIYSLVLNNKQILKTRWGSLSAPVQAAIVSSIVGSLIGFSLGRLSSKRHSKIT